MSSNEDTPGNAPEDPGSSEPSDERRGIGQGEGQGPPEFVFENREKAHERAQNHNGSANVTRKKIDGKQRWVVEKKVDTDTSAPADLELWRDDQ